VPDFEDTERDVFKRLEIRDQSMALFDMLRYVRAEIAGTRRDLIEMRDDMKNYRRTREEKEQGTTEKIEAVLNKRFDLLKWFTDKVLPAIVTFILFALLYLAFNKP
jgi:hypothetical protein